MSNGGKDFPIPPMVPSIGENYARTDKLNKFKQISDRGAFQDESSAKEAAEQFEALLLHELFQEMWNSVPSNGLISGGREEEYYRDMLSEGMAQSAAKGQGVGIKEVILKDFERAKRHYKRSEGGGPE